MDRHTLVKSEARACFSVVSDGDSFGGLPGLAWLLGVQECTDRFDFKLSVGDSCVIFR